jgi:hypothetical protein
MVGIVHHNFDSHQARMLPPTHYPPTSFHSHRYPSLQRRKLTSYERAHLQSQGNALTPVCTVVRAVEVDDLQANRTSRNAMQALVPEHSAIPRIDRG